MKRCCFLILLLTVTLLMFACKKAEQVSAEPSQQAESTEISPVAEPAAAPTGLDHSSENRKGAVAEQEATEPDETPSVTENPLPDDPKKPAETKTEAVSKPAEKTDSPASAGLKGTVGNFFKVSTSEPFLEYREDGQCYGYVENYTDGCSVWCAVLEHSIDVTASSYLAPQGKFSYEPEHICNSDRINAWIEGVSGYGVGEFVEITHSYTVSDTDYGVDFRSLCVVNGYAQTARKWAENSRVKELKLYLNGAFVDTLLLEDTIQPQYFDLTGYKLRADSGAESVFRFEIASVYPGTKYDDTAITGIEIEFWTPNH